MSILLYHLYLGNGTGGESIYGGTFKGKMMIYIYNLYIVIEANINFAQDIDWKIVFKYILGITKYLQRFT